MQWCPERSGHHAEPHWKHTETNPGFEESRVILCGGNPFAGWALVSGLYSPRGGCWGRGGDVVGAAVTLLLVPAS